ncbi:MAG: hypothetical protein RLW62_20020 [Gammaproteobacteria bacterium]
MQKNDMTIASIANRPNVVFTTPLLNSRTCVASRITVTIPTRS